MTNSEIIVGLINEHLVGAKITGATLKPDEGDGMQWYTIDLDLDGEKRYLEPSIDPEGNAPGFLFMEV